MDWSVVQRTAYADCEALRVDRAAGSGSRTFLIPFDRPRRLDEGRLTVVSLRAWLHAFERLLLDTHPHGGLRYYPSTLELIPYQLEPALAMLRDGHPRMLIADDVGLGKTVEAGLILRELAERHDGFRALVLVPAGLRHQWHDELAGRFVRDVIQADASWLRTIARTFPVDLNPWSPPGVYLASFDFIKRPEALRPLEEVRWDLVVVDEAHAATIATDRRAAVDAVASLARRVILMTATPPADPAEFGALCRIGASIREPDVVLFQRGRASRVGLARRSSMLAVRTNADERRMHRMLERYTSLVWREAGRRGNAQGRLATIVLRKRALSSAASLDASVRRRLDLLASAPVPVETQLVLPLDESEMDAGEDLVPDTLLASPGLSDSASEERWLRVVLTAAEAAARQDSKLRVLMRLLSRIQEPAIVFTEYRDTLERLRQFLQQRGHASCVLHGGLSATERRQVLTDFARGGRTLLATDAAAEGLNLQHACRVIVHYELPWNPSRMLQRAGRVDRFGQQRRVHEIALVASDTAESLVLAPLVRRAIGRLTLGATDRMLELLSESRVAEAVFEGLPREPWMPAPIAAPAVAIDVIADGVSEALRLQRRRALTGRRPRLSERSRPAIHVAVMTRASLAPGVVLVFDLKAAGPQGEVVERTIAAIHASLAVRQWPRRSRLIRERLVRLLPAILAAVSATVHRLGQRQIDRVQPRAAEALARARAREKEIHERHDSAARQLVQAGLFDRRLPRRAPSAARAADFLEEPHIPLEKAPSELRASADLRAVLVVSGR